MRVFDDDDGRILKLKAIMNSSDEGRMESLRTSRLRVIRERQLYTLGST